MKATLHTEPFHYILLENFYDEIELEWVCAELNLFTRGEGFKLPDQKISAYDEETGELLRTNKVRFLDSVYNEAREVSAILTYNRKIFKPEILNPKESWFFSTFSPTRDVTLLSYYTGGDIYHAHQDNATCTALTWFYRQPKKFDGGDLTFSDYGIKVGCKHNCGVIFPSQIRHEVSEIKPKEEDLGPQWGRFCISQFLQVV
jgi:hypothetical protein